MPKTPLNPSPIAILSQDFWEVSLRGSLEHEHGVGDIEVERQVFSVEDNPQQWRVYLQIDLTALEGEKPPPYTGRIIARGFYEVHEEYPHDPERLVRITGASMLYGAVREMVTSVTARGPHGMLTLPSVSFFENNASKIPAKRAAKKTTKKATKKRAAKAK